MRADRLISILLQLQAHERITAAELAERLEVSERTIHRDMEALSGAGFPVYAERGVGGGWSLLEGYKTNFTALNEAEIQTIFLSKPQGVLTDLGLNDAADTALNKLLASLPAIYRRDAEYYQQRIHIDTSRWSDSEDVSFLPLLQEAVWQEKQIEVTYKLSRGPVIEPILHPLGLVAKGSIWYLVAAFDKEIGVYRVANVEDVRIMEDACIRPASFDLARFWAKSSKEFAARIPPFKVTVRVAPMGVEKISEQCSYPRVEMARPPCSNGWQTYHLFFETEDEAFSYSIKYGAQLEVVSPISLRSRLIAHVEEMATFYSENMSMSPNGISQRRYSERRRLAA